MGMSVDFQPHDEIQASSKVYEGSDFVTLEIKSSDAGVITVYLHNVEDAVSLFQAAKDAVANTVRLESDRGKKAELSV